MGPSYLLNCVARSVHMEMPSTYVAAIYYEAYKFSELEDIIKD